MNAPACYLCVHDPNFVFNKSEKKKTQTLQRIENKMKKKRVADSFFLLLLLVLFMYGVLIPVSL